MQPPEIPQPEQSESEITPEQEERLKQIRRSRIEIGRFDNPPGNSPTRNYDHWVKTRPYQSRAEAVQAFADMTGVTPQDVQAMVEEQGKARATMEYWDQQRLYIAPWAAQPSPQWKYEQANGAWSDTLRKEKDLINKAVIEFKGSANPNPIPATTPQN